MIAAYNKEKWPRSTSSAMMAMGNVGGSGVEFESSKVVEGAWFGWQILEALTCSKQGQREPQEERYGMILAKLKCYERRIVYTRQTMILTSHWWTMIRSKAAPIFDLFARESISTL